VYNRVFPAFVIAIAALLAPREASAAKFVADLTSVKITARAGQVMTHPYHLTLDAGERSTRFKFRIEDWWRSEDGQKSFYAAPGTLKRSCGNWVALNPVEASVEPGATLDTRLTITVPKDASPGGYWCVLTVDEVADPLAAPAGVGAQFVASVSTGIFINIDPVERAAEFVDVQINGSDALVKVQNRGNAPIGVEGRVEFFRPGGLSLVAVAPIPRATVLTEPVTTSVFRASLPPVADLPSGRYLVRVIVDIGLDHYLGIERELDLSRDAGSSDIP
jgi:hypothetical protein